MLTDRFLIVAIAGAAGFAAMRAYESHLRATGQEPSHALMKVCITKAFPQRTSYLTQIL